MNTVLTLAEPTTFQTLRHTARLALETLGCWIFADFLTGLVHWWEDAYAQAHWPVLGPLVADPNLLHHRDPRAMTRMPWWRNVDVPVIGGALFLGALALLHALAWPLALTISLAALTNLAHRWAHQNSRENGVVITWLQARGIIQSRAHHALHHRWPRESHYCPLTNFLNPILERLGFWPALERGILRLTGIRRRQEPRPGSAH